MKTIKLMCLAISLLGLMLDNSLWARGGGGGHYYGGGGYRVGHGGYGGRGYYGRYGGYGLGLGLGLGYGLGYGGYGLGYGGYGLGYGGYGLGYGGYGLGYGGYGLGYGGYPPISIPETPPVYIEQQDFVKSTAESQKNYWYYCQDPAGYYPYIRECPNGWLPVSPQPLNK